MWWRHAVHQTRALHRQSSDSSCHVLHVHYISMFWCYHGDVLNIPGAYCWIKFCPTVAELCLLQALATASSGNSEVTASCSDREDKLLNSPLRPKLRDEAGDRLWVCSQTEVKDCPVCWHYAQKCRLTADVQLSHRILLSEPVEAGVRCKVSR